jgi:hypothetical protein
MDRQEHVHDSSSIYNNNNNNIIIIIIIIILPYAPGESETEGCLYPCGGAISALVAVNSIPPEPQLSWLFGRYMIMPF